MALTAAADAIAAGTLTARALADAQLARVAATDAAIEAWAHLDAAHVRAEADRLDAAPACGDHADRPRSAARHRHRREGHRRDGGRAHADGVADLRGPSAGTGRRMRRAAEARGRLRLRQGGDDGVRVPRSGEDEEPVECAPHARRLVVGAGRRGGRGARRRRDRHADQRLGDPARGVLRRRRVQADEGRDSLLGRASFQRDAGPARDVHALGRRRRAACERARRRDAHFAGAGDDARSRRGSPTSTAFPGRRKSTATRTTRSTRRRRRCASMAPRSSRSPFRRDGARRISCSGRSCCTRR